MAIFTETTSNIIKHNTKLQLCTTKWGADVGMDPHVSTLLCKERNLASAWFSIQRIQLNSC